MLVATIAPIINCPSPPIFQNFILKASESPKDVISKGTNELIKLLIVLRGAALPTRPILITSK